MKVVIANGHIVTPKEERFAEVVVESGVIKSLGGPSPKFSGEQFTTLDASDCWVTPGLIDLQVNGGPQCDFWSDLTRSDVAAFAEQLAKSGVTTILPTLITGDLTLLNKHKAFLENELGVGFEQLKPASADSPSSKRAADAHLSVRMPGIHLEGPCLSPQRPGVHPPQHLQPLDLKVLKQIISPSVKLVTLAPELDSSGEAVSWLQQQNVCVSLGHSNATYEQAEKAFNSGIAMMTHTYNALPPIHHRAPGAVTAALLDNAVSCCLICDGQHVSPAAAKLVVRMKGIDKTILVTDIASVGTSQGGLVGSSITLDMAVRNAVDWGLASFQQAITMASFNPAKAMGWDQYIGELAPGRQADIVIWNKKDLSIKHVLVRGCLLA